RFLRFSGNFVSAALKGLLAASRASCRTIDRSNGVESARAGMMIPLAADDASGKEAAACRKRRRFKEPPERVRVTLRNSHCGRRFLARNPNLPRPSASVHALPWKA